MTPNLLFKFLICILVFSGTIYADEIITDFDESRSLPILNEVLRDQKNDIEELKATGFDKEPRELTISSGAVTVNQSSHSVDTEADAASDDLATINGMRSGSLLVVYASSSSRTVVLKDGTGNLKLSGDCTLDNTEDIATLIKIGSNWQLVACTSNGA